MCGDYQGELFEEFNKKENPLKRMARHILPKRRPHVFYLHLEQAMSIAIFVILGFIIFFALGVEKGKRQSKVKIEERGIAVTETENIEITKDTDIEKDREVEVEKPYTIQLISYKDKGKALAKVKELEKNGIRAEIIKQNSWFQVCAGSYLNKEEAAADLSNFAKEYKGCFLRRR